MALNWIGLVSAAATFLGVWIGHVSVRKIEREVERLWIPSTIALVLGFGFEIVSLRTSNLLLSAACGIVGMTLFWDSLEFYRQHKRIRHGHAPANPKNARHARILQSCPHATVVDWLAREPREIPYSREELLRTQEYST
jgi:hypothetical protein